MATTWNPSDKGTGVTLSNGNLTALATTNNQNSTRATDYISGSAKRYFTVTIDAVLGSPTYCPLVGLSNTSHALTTALGNDANSIGYRSDGVVRYNNATLTTLASFTTGSVIGIAVDYAAGKIWFRVGSGNWNNDAAANPATNTNGLTIGATGNLFPDVSLYNTAQVTANFSSPSSPPS